MRRSIRMRDDDAVQLVWACLSHATSQPAHCLLDFVLVQACELEARVWSSPTVEAPVPQRLLPRGLFILSKIEHADQKWHWQPITIGQGLIHEICVHPAESSLAGDDDLTGAPNYYQRC